jgi:hypothetical protein
MIAKRRLEICKSNKCGFYNEAGDLPIVVVKGKPACGGCGCSLEYKCRVLSESCTLMQLGKLPLWEDEMTEAEEKKFRDKTGIKNEV